MCPSLIFLTLLLPDAPLPEAKKMGLQFPGLADRIVVTFPADYDASKKWPAVLYYHGTSGKPTTELIRSHTGETGWFTVGMTYAQRGPFTLTPDTLETELTILRSVRHYLINNFNVDQKRTYVAGFSKGGWSAGYFLQAEPQLAGAIILGAGHLHKVKAVIPKFRRRKPVFVGIGRQDGNYPYALNAITFYRERGATTTLNTWHDHEHQYPKTKSTALTQWLALEGNPSADHQSAANVWGITRLSEIKGIPDPTNRWVALLDMQACPYFPLLTDAQKATIHKTRTALEKTAVVSPEAKALTKHRTLLRTEIADRSKENAEKMQAAYLKLANANPNTRQGAIALHDHERMKRMLLHLEAQDKIAKEKEKEAPAPKEDPFDPDKKEKRDRGFPINPILR